MIVLGAYPNSITDYKPSCTPLRMLHYMLDQIAPRHIALHLLPFCKSSGDGGFSQDDWFSISPELGSWEDIELIAKSRKLIVDAVYNHVSKKHKFFREFCSTFKSDNLFVYDANIDHEFPDSPRSGSVVRPHVIGGKNWNIWQTFTEESVDINLDSQEVLNQIEEHLNMLSKRGIWGVRMDALAYYGKALGKNQVRHSKDSYRLARKIARMVMDRGLQVTAQLDCDDMGLKYFPSDLGFNISTVDYSYAPYLALSLLEQNPEYIVANLKSTWNLPAPPLRAPRNHDGILLLSKNFDINHRSKILKIADSFNIKPLISNSLTYELNCSLPYLFSRGVSESVLNKRINLAMSLTGVTPGWCYLYLPFIIGYIPELNCTDVSHPRLVNRMPVGFDFIENYISSEQGKFRFNMLDFLASLTAGSHADVASEDDLVSIPMKSLISIKRPVLNVHYIANISNDNEVDVGTIINKNRMLFGSSVAGARIGPLGFGFWHIR